MGYEGMNTVITKLQGGQVNEFLGLDTKLLTKANAPNLPTIRRSPESDGVTRRGFLNRRGPAREGGARPGRDVRG